MVAFSDGVMTSVDKVSKKKKRKKKLKKSVKGRGKAIT